MISKKDILTLAILASFFIGCGGGSSSSSDTTTSTTTTTTTEDTSSGSSSSSSDSSSSTGTVSSTITDTISKGTSEGDTSNTGTDEDDLVANSDFSSSVQIAFTNGDATIVNSVDGVAITKSNGIVEVNSTVSGVAYEVSGSTTSGGLKIYSDKKFKLTLNNVTIQSSDSPAINIQSKKRVFVVLDGTNSLTDVATYSNIPDGEDAKATFFSEGQLIFSGDGTLSVAGKYKHGITSDDYIRVIEGNITVTEAVKDALHSNDYMIFDGGELNLTASSDGIDCDEGYIIINDGTFNLSVVDDGIAASYDIDEEDEPDESITPNVTINGGTFNITTTEGEGIESKGVMTINDGTININAVDDGLNAGGILYINGGKSYVYSSTNDAIDSNTAITVTGGITIAYSTATSSPEGSFDADANTFKITGGTLLGLAANTTVPSATESTQNSVMFDGVSANSILHIQASDGTEALTFKMSNKVDTILYSSAKLQTGTTYSIYSGGDGSISNGVDFHGLYTSGTYTTTSSAIQSFTIESVVTQIGGTVGPSGDPADGQGGGTNVPPNGGGTPQNGAPAN